MKKNENKNKRIDPREKLAMRVSRNTILINLLLSAGKLFAGLAGQSAAMVSDAVHSASDVLSTLVVMAGIRLSGRDSDANHPYGHERLECVASILLAIMLCATGLLIGWSGIRKVILSSGAWADGGAWAFGGAWVDGGTRAYSGAGTALPVPGMMPLAAAVLSVAVKEAMYHYTKSAARKTDSGALMADAWHHRSDALSSVGSFAGILGARMGYPVLDPLACVLISLFIVKASGSIFMDAIRKMTDEACSREVTEEIRTVILGQEGVLGLDDMKTRMFGSRIYVDIEICADGEATLNETHRTAERVHWAVETAFPCVKHCMVHVNPWRNLDDVPENIV